MSLFARAAGLLRTSLQRAQGVTVSIVRGEERTDDVAAAVSSTKFQEPQDDGTFVEIESRDYLIAAAEYLVDELVVEPREGDRLLETIGGRTLEYEALGFGDAPCWEWWDTTHTTLRVRTKLVDQVEDEEEED